ncbi:hypothetical protein [Hymenobacter volaticus]|uniref:Uncharacterized protein n=1 Tax=Hymenobacter volaticus TaxID=2932254 RepID=A0ABY4G055_9BACT|nr:hypothetical protein [Hymenobacter volaticus]UOQ64259.1 hypothetical protein MUN86_11670 [Hymenobacter volaticus]
MSHKRVGSKKAAHFTATPMLIRPSGKACCTAPDADGTVQLPLTAQSRSGGLCAVEAPGAGPDRLAGSCFEWQVVVAKSV